VLSASRGKNHDDVCPLRVLFLARGSRADSQTGRPISDRQTDSWRAAPGQTVGQTGQFQTDRQKDRQILGARLLGRQSDRQTNFRQTDRQILGARLQGLVVRERGDAEALEDHKLPYCHAGVAACPDLLSAVAAIKPSVYVGMASVGPSFPITREVSGALPSFFHYV
jgi:hypothetical protein